MTTAQTQAMEGGVAMLVKRILAALILSGLLSVPGLAQAQTTGALYILSPANGQNIETRFVRLQFELVPGVSANGIPEFKVQLDKENPALTSDTEYFFYWLSPGWHSVSVSLVDANGTPIFGVQNQVQFYV
jgi:hypothetical protein